MQTRSKLNRAKLFLSYDALKGFKERIHEKERIVVNKPILLIIVHFLLTVLICTKWYAVTARLKTAACLSTII